MKSIIIIIVSFLLLNEDEKQPYRLVEEDAGASCFNYSVIDEKEKTVKLPKHIRNGLECPYSIGLNGNFLTYVDDLRVKLYNLETKEDFLLFTLYDDIDGFSAPAWSNDGIQLAFVVVNQEQNHGYTSFCRIIYCELNMDGSLLKKRKFDRPVNYECGSICTSDPGSDFMFEPSGQLIYKHHLMYTDGDELWEVLEL